MNQNCPSPQKCVLEVKDGKVHCQKHNNFLIIDNDDKDCHIWVPIPMRHILYIAAISPKGNGYVRLDSEQ